MHVNLDAFTRQLADLIGRFADQGAKLGEAARELQDGGAPPADGLVEALAAARLEFVELRAEIVLAAETLGVAVPDVVECATSLEPVLTAMASALEAQQRRAAFEEARDGVVALLDRIAGLGHQDDENFGPLVTVKLRAAELKTAALAATNTEQARSVAATAQPFADLLMMLDTTEGLDDQRFSALEESVARAFGRQITVAVARGRLLLPGQTPRPARAERSASAPEPAAPEPVRLADAMRVPDPVRVAPAEPIIAAAPAASETLEDVETVAPPYEPQPTDEPAPSYEPPPVEPEPSDEPPPPEPAPSDEPPPEPAYEPEPVVASAPPGPTQQPAASRSETSGTDETAQWWLAAWARWSGWKNTLGFPEATREELGKYPYLLSVPIQQSPEYEDGLLAYGYSIILQHVEKQSPGAVGNALDNLKTGQMKPVGTQLYEYLVAQGRLTETYPDFLKNVLKAAIPEPGPWVQARIIHSKDDTRVFQRPTGRVGETEQTARRFLADNQRFKEHTFGATLPPLTTRFFLIQAELRDAHGVEAKLTIDGAPSDAGLVATVPAAGKSSKMEIRRFTAEGTPVPGVGRDYAAIWFAVFNADALRQSEFQLVLTLRKDTRGMRK